MRIAGLLLASLLVACSSNPNEPIRPEPQIGPEARPEVEPANPVADPVPTDPMTADPAPADPAPAGPSVARAGDDIELGTPVMIAPDKIYPVRGTELTIEQLGASMANASDGQGNDFHYVTADIVLTKGGAEYRVVMAGGQPTEWKGFRVTLDELGFDYDKSDVNILVERVE
jgi:hypothetical protein